jgi:CRP-like cAMP-binding protein
MTSASHDCSSCVLNAQGSCPFVPKAVPAGTTLWMQGDVPGEVLFVREGLLSQSASEPSGSETMSAVRGSHALLGLEAVQSLPSGVTVETLTDATVCVAEVPVLQRWLGGPSPANAMLGLALEEISRSSRELTMRSGPSLARVARFLLDFAKLIDAGRQAPFSKQHVARLLGMRAETLSRCLRQLVDDGLIESGRHVKVRDAERLAAVANGPI